MREPTKASPADRGEVTLRGRCEICGVEGEVVALPAVEPPNQLCQRCAIEYLESRVGDDEELRP
ncbi:MAG TPA: hypothetical protein VFE30_10375 [Anaeromyxobacteraceae bacterium]|jgi:hypothetical protein|nr:hypothetical protein [Anaeromyxobacteraceae bacterium]